MSISTYEDFWIPMICSHVLLLQEKCTYIKQNYTTGHKRTVSDTLSLSPFLGIHKVGFISRAYFFLDTIIIIFHVNTASLKAFFMVNKAILLSFVVCKGSLERHRICPTPEAFTRNNVCLCLCSSTKSKDCFTYCRLPPECLSQKWKSWSMGHLLAIRYQSDGVYFYFFLCIFLKTTTTCAQNFNPLNS